MSTRGYDGIGRLSSLLHTAVASSTTTSIVSLSQPFGLRYLHGDLDPTSGASLDIAVDPVGRVTERKVRAQGGAVLAGGDYGYDQVGNLKCRIDGASGSIEMFAYDGFHRLADWWQDTGDCDLRRPAATAHVDDAIEPPNTSSLNPPPTARERNRAWSSREKCREPVRRLQRESLSAGSANRDVPAYRGRSRG